MKVGMVMLVGVFFGVTSIAQNSAPTGKPRQEIQVEAPRAEATSEVSTNALSTGKTGATGTNKPPIIFYSGLGHDIAKSTNRWRMFSLRKPANAKEDGANLIRDTRTEAARPIKLISIDF